MSESLSSKGRPQGGATQQPNPKGQEPRWTMECLDKLLPAVERLGRLTNPSAGELLRNHHHVVEADYVESIREILIEHGIISK